MTVVASERCVIGRITCDGWPKVELGCPYDRIIVLDNPREQVMKSGGRGDRLFFSEEAARAHAALFGWGFEDGRDLCPGCRAKREESMR